MDRDNACTGILAVWNHDSSIPFVEFSPSLLVCRPNHQQQHIGHQYPSTHKALFVRKRLVRFEVCQDDLPRVIRSFPTCILTHARIPNTSLQLSRTSSAHDDSHLIPCRFNLRWIRSPVSRGFSKLHVHSADNGSFR